MIRCTSFYGQRYTRSNTRLLGIGNGTDTKQQNVKNPEPTHKPLTSPGLLPNSLDREEFLPTNYRQHKYKVE